VDGQLALRGTTGGWEGGTGGNGPWGRRQSRKKTRKEGTPHNRMCNKDQKDMSGVGNGKNSSGGGGVGGCRKLLGVTTHCNSSSSREVGGKRANVRQGLQGEC